MITLFCGDEKDHILRYTEKLKYLATRLQFSDKQKREEGSVKQVEEARSKIMMQHAHCLQRLGQCKTPFEKTMVLFQRSQYIQLQKIDINGDLLAKQEVIDRFKRNKENVKKIDDYIPKVLSTIKKEKETRDKALHNLRQGSNYEISTIKKEILGNAIMSCDTLTKYCNQAKTANEKVSKYLESQKKEINEARKEYQERILEVQYPVDSNLQKIKQCIELLEKISASEFENQWQQYQLLLLNHEQDKELLYSAFIDDFDLFPEPGENDEELIDELKQTYEGLKEEVKETKVGVLKAPDEATKLIVQFTSLYDDIEKTFAKPAEQLDCVRKKM